jgi:uncharacterized membrane protein YccC
MCESPESNSSASPSTDRGDSRFLKSSATRRVHLVLGCVLARVPGSIEHLRVWWPSEAFYAIRLGLTSIVAIYLSMLLEFQKPEWAGWTVLSVTLATRASSLQKSLWRAGSSLVGGMVAILMVANFAQSTLAFDIALAAWLATTSAAASVERGQRSYGFALLGFTVPIVTLTNVDYPEMVFQTAVDRCSTLLLGIACAYASAILVDRGVRSVSIMLASQFEAVVITCRQWLADVAEERPPGPLPIAAVLVLDSAIADSFTEQPSLETGGRVVSSAPIRLLEVLMVGLLRGNRDGVRAAALLGIGNDGVERRLRQVEVAGRLLRAGRRIDNRHASLRALSIDRDGRQTFNMALRAAIAVLLTSAFWYASEWPSGGQAVTWAALVSALFAGRANSVVAARNFMIGAVMAAAVGLVVHYTALTSNGNFPVLATVLLPVLMVAALGRSDKRVAFGGGYGLLILNIISPDNVMDYHLDSTLNDVLADLLGMAVAIIAFAALPPPASPVTRRWRTRRRMAKALHAVAFRSSFLLPSQAQWLGRMFDRLAQLAPEDAAVIQGGQALLLIGSLLLILRERDDRLGREIGMVIYAGGAHAAPSIARIADRPGYTPIQRGRIEAMAKLLLTPVCKVGRV